MSDKPMRWALEGTGTWTPGEVPTEGELVEARSFQRAAEPILAVVRVLEAHVQFLEEKGLGDYYRETSELFKLLPAALKAMEEHGS